MYQPNQKKIITTLSASTLIAALIMMLGWVFNIHPPNSVIPGLDTVKFNTALCFFLFSTALLLRYFNTNLTGSVLFPLLSLLGFIIGVVTLSQDIFQARGGLDQLFVVDNTPVSYSFPYPGRMAFNASLSFSMMGLAFFSLLINKRPFNLLSQVLFHAVTILSGIALIGYLYGFSFFRELLYQTSMSPYTAVLFLLLSIAATLLNPSLGVAALFTGNRIGNKMAGRLFSLMIVMVVVFGALRFQTRQLSLFSSLSFTISILSVFFLLCGLLLIWNTANWLNRIDDSRRAAEEQVRQMNTILEQRVEEGSVQYKKSEEKYRTLIQQASDAIYILNREGNFTDANESMCKMTGYTSDELMTMNVTDIIDPEELKIDPLPLNLMGTMPAIIRDRRFRSKNGEIFTVEINVKMFSNNVMVIARDITGRKKMEAELKEAELKFRTIAEKSMVGVYIVQKGKFTYVNPRFAAVFGYTPEELINTFDIEMVFDESYRATATENVRRRMTGEIESVHYEAMGRKKSGESNWIEFYGSRTLLGGEPTIIGSMIDVTERKIATEELRSSELKYKLIFESNPMPMWMIAKDDQTIIAVNDAACTRYGYTKEELLHMNSRAMRPAEDYDLQLAGYKKNLSRSSDMGVVRHLKKDGSFIYVNIFAHDIIFEGRPVRLSLTNDITEKLIAEEALRKSEANLQTILNTTDTAYALFGTDLKVQAFNQRTTQFIKEQYGHNPQKGDALPDYFPQERFPKFISFASKVLRGENINYEIGYPQKDGSQLWYDIRLFPIANDNNEVLGILIALHDITERKLAEQHLKSAYDRIQNHINSIKDMAWKQSHLIRSPLANLKALVGMLKEDANDTQVFNHINNELNRMDAIIIEMAQDASDHDVPQPNQ